MMNPDSTPLAGLVVIELGHSVAAPFAGQILADLGAEVIKVEKAEGDDARHWGPPFWEGASSSFQPLNRSKKSVVCELRDPAQLADKPARIYCNVGAFGRAGPLKDRPGYDPLMQAFGGIMSTTGEAGRPPVRVGPSIVDLGTGMWAVIGMLTALNRRRDTGRGGVIDVSLFETCLLYTSPSPRD